MRNSLIAGFLIVIHANVFAQTTGLTSPTNGFNTGSSYFDSGPNYSHFRKENFFQGNDFITQYDQLTWFAFDDDDDDDKKREPIEEIIITGKRWGLNPLAQITAHFRYGPLWDKRCVHYSDGGNCLSWQNVFNRDDFPLEGTCQTVSGTMGPLTGEDANQLNLQRQQAQALGTGLSTTSASLFGVFATQGSSIAVQLLTTGALSGGTFAATYPNIGDFPFEEGNLVTYTVNACNNENGGIDMDIDVTIQ